MRFGPAILAVAIGVGFAPLAQATSLRISPIGVDIPSTQRAASLSITNSDADSVSLQIRIFKWTQVGGDDVLEPANDILVSPPAVTIPAGASYTIRVARPSASPVAGELTYRLFVDELPKPIDPRAVSQGVSMVLRTSMPVFIADKKAVAHLSWRAWQDQAGIHVEVNNTGQRHSRLSAMSLRDGANHAISFGEGLNGYVLPGSTKSFLVKAAGGNALPVLSAGNVTLTAKTDTLDVNEVVRFDAR